MATIQELYNKHIKGEISREKFLYEARRDAKLSQFITNLTSYNDAIRILKNRNVITEARKKVEAITLDQANPYEVKKGIDYELELCGCSSPNILPEDYHKAQKKVLTNLAKDPSFYTKTLAGMKPDGDLASDAERGESSKRSDVPVALKKDNFVDNKNGVKEVSKKESSNVKDTLGQKEKAKNKNPKGIKLMTMVPKKAKGVKLMDLPGKEKKIRIKEGVEEGAYSRAGVGSWGSKPKPKPKPPVKENIPQTNSNFLPFAKVQPGMTAKDDSGESFKVIAKGNYNDLKRFDSSKSMDKFLSSDPTGVDGNQLVALIDAEGNTFVRVYGTGGVYVFDKGQMSEYGNQEDLKNKKKAYLQAKMKADQEEYNNLRENDEFKADIVNKEIPQNEVDIAEAKASILVTITKAYLNKNVNLDKDMQIKDGRIWVRVPLGYGVLDKDQLKAICGDSKFLGLNPISDTEVTLIFDKK